MMKMRNILFGLMLGLIAPSCLASDQPEEERGQVNRVLNEEFSPVLRQVSRAGFLLDLARDGLNFVHISGVGDELSIAPYYPFIEVPRVLCNVASFYLICDQVDKVKKRGGSMSVRQSRLLCTYLAHNLLSIRQVMTGPKINIFVDVMYLMTTLIIFDIMLSSKNAPNAATVGNNNTAKKAAKKSGSRK